MRTSGLLPVLPILVILAVAFVYMPCAGAAMPKPVALASDQLELTLDHKTGGLLGVLNRHTGKRKATRGVPFTIVTDREIITGKQAELVESRRTPLTATFRFRTTHLDIQLTYRLRSAQAHFAEKFLTLTERAQKPIVIDTLILMELAFNPPPVQVKFHAGGLVSNHPVVSPDVPINLFLRDSGGGLFLGIENPYFGVHRIGNTLSLQFRPRWLLPPGDSFQSDPAFLGVYKSAGIYTFNSTKRPAQDRPSPTDAQEILDWGEVWAMQDFMRQVLTPDRPPGKGYPVICNACGGMEYLWRLREAPAKFTPEGRLIPDASVSLTEDEREFVKRFAGSSRWTKEIVHGAFRASWVELPNPH